MELNKEQIIKALECCEHIQCQGEHCPYHPLDRCREQLRHDCYALINELTEENERLRADNETLDILVKDLRGRNNGLQRANESLAKDCDILEDELNECVNIKSDTVRKVQERLKKAFNFGHTILEKSICDIIDQIANEMLEGYNEK